MAIKKIETIYINGSNSAFGAYIYHAKFEPFSFEQPSQINMALVYKDENDLQEPDLSCLVPYQIKIGNNKPINMYLTEYSLDISNQGRILNVIFEDGSFILDKKFVGLEKRHGRKETDNFKGSCLLIVGNEIHPCDTDGDGDLTKLDELELKNPCETNCGDDAGTLHCAVVTRTKILDVQYTFRQLIEAMIVNGIPLGDVPQEYNDFYKIREAGTLREVLKTFCAAFGFVFYWEDDKLNFLDAGAGIIVDFSFLDQYCKENYRKTKSLKGTYKQAFINYYGISGDVKTSNCTDSRTIGLRCFSLGDLYLKSQYSRPDNASIGENSSFAAQTYEPYNCPMSVFEAAISLRKYSPAIRDAFLWYDFYNIQNATNLAAFKNKTLPAFGNMQIVEIMSQNNLSSIYNDLLNIYITNTIGEAGDVAFQDRRNQYSRMFKDKEFYFFLAYVDEAEYNKMISKEKLLADDFLGQYYFRAIDFYTDDRSSVSVQGATYYHRGETLADLPFFRPEFEVKTGSNIDVLLQGNKYVYPPSDGKPARQGTTYLLAKKNAIWYPPNDQIAAANDFANQYIFENLEGQEYEQIIYKLMNFSNAGINDVYRKDYKVAGKYYKLFKVAKNPYKDVLRVVDNDTNLFEEEPSLYYSTKYQTNIKVGLTSKNCTSYIWDGLKISLPAWGSVYQNQELQVNDATNKITSVNSAPYVAVAEISESHYIVIPKIETVLKSNEFSCKDNVLSCHYNVRDISNVDFRVLSQEQTCIPSPKLLQEYHEKFSKDLEYSIDSPIQTFEFTVYGIDLPGAPTMSVKNGLKSMDISWDETGVKTTYTFSNERLVPPDPDFLTRKLEFALNHAYSNSLGSMWTANSNTSKPNVT